VSAPEMALHLHTGPELQNTSVTHRNQGILMIFIVTKWFLMIKNTYLHPYKTWSSNWNTTVVIQTLLHNWFFILSCLIIVMAWKSPHPTPHFVQCVVTSNH
jgi:hypothetical protein